MPDKVKFVHPNYLCPDTVHVTCGVHVRTTVYYHGDHQQSQGLPAAHTHTHTHTSSHYLRSPTPIFHHCHCTCTSGYVVVHTPSHCHVISQVSCVVLINCGGCAKLLELLRPEEHILFFVIDRWVHVGPGQAFHCGLSVLYLSFRLFFSAATGP